MTLYEREQERLEIARQESYEEGKEEGKKEGLKEGLKEGRKAGLDIGLREGRAEERANMLKSVKSMMADGVPADYLKKMMKLTEEEVKYVLQK